MIIFDEFTTTYDKCQSLSLIGVEDTFDGDAVIIAKCTKCDNIEKMQTEIGNIE